MRYAGQRRPRLLATSASAPESPPPAPGRAVVFKRSHRLWLLAATAVAAALRFLHLGEWSLWIDEAHSWRDATMPLEGFTGSDRVFYPATFLLLRGLISTGLLDQGEWSLRLPFVLFGIATVPLLGLCGRRLVGATPSVLAAWLLAVNPWHVFWSQNARAYVIVVLAAVIAIERAFAYARAPRTRDMIAVVLAIAVGTMGHATAGLLAVALVAFFALRPVQRVGVRTVLLLAMLAGALALALPWLAELFFADFLRSKGETPSVRHFVQTTGFYFRPVALLVAVVGLWLLRWIGGRDRALLLGCFLVVPFLVLLVVGDQLVLVTARYAICTLPAISWLAAFACVRTSEALRALPGVPALARNAAAAVLPLLVIGDYVVELAPYYGSQHGQRGRWREVADLLRERAGGAPIRVLTVNQRTLEYYLRPGHWADKVPPAYERNQVMPVLDWLMHDGVDERKSKVHEPGARNHIAWHLAAARERGALFAVVVTWPELVEQDEDSALRRELAHEFELAAYLPCWVGPKDESIHVFLPKEP